MVREGWKLRRKDREVIESEKKLKGVREEEGSCPETKLIEDDPEAGIMSDEDVEYVPQKVADVAGKTSQSWNRISQKRFRRLVPRTGLRQRRVTDLQQKMGKKTILVVWRMAVDQS